MHRLTTRRGFLKYWSSTNRSGRCYRQQREPSDFHGRPGGALLPAWDAIREVAGVSGLPEKRSPLLGPPVQAGPELPGPHARPFC